MLLPFVGDFSGFADESEDGIVDGVGMPRSCLGIDRGGICRGLIGVEVHGFGFPCLSCCINACDCSGMVGFTLGA